MNEEILVKRLADKQCPICGKELKKEESILVNHEILGTILVCNTHKTEGEVLK